jgi:molecular chaperone IbpA
MRTAFDFTPLYGSMIGADHIADTIEAAMRGQRDSHYPPYDIEKIAEDQYRITLAVAGFRPEELNLVAQPNQLVVSGVRGENEERAYLHRGISGRDFERRFELADYVMVRSADYKDGLLTIDLVREIPEALKPRRIEISVGSADSGPRVVKAERARQAA